MRSRRTKATTAGGAATNATKVDPLKGRAREQLLEKIAATLNPAGRAAEEIITAQAKADVLLAQTGITPKEVQDWVLAHTGNAARQARQRQRARATTAA